MPSPTPARRRGDVHLVPDLPLGAEPDEGPVEHLRAALALLVAHETAHPAVWTYSPELRQAESRLFRALFHVDGRVP